MSFLICDRLEVNIHTAILLKSILVKQSRNVFHKTTNFHKRVQLSQEIIKMIGKLHFSKKIKSVYKISIAASAI